MRVPQRQSYPQEPIRLRDYQREMLAAVTEAAKRGVYRQLGVLPTGCGKTIVFGSLIAQRPGRALVLVHRDELARQAVEKLALVAPHLPVGVVKAERDEHMAPVVVASVQTLARPRRLERLTPDFRTVVIDEAHHLAAPTYRRVLDHLDASAPLMFGVTATPERADGQPLDGWEIIYRRELREMILGGYLCDLRALQIRLARADFGALHVRAGDFIDSEAGAMLLDADAPAHAVTAYQQHAAGRRALVFTPTVGVANAMAKAFEGAGISAAAVDGETPLEIRRETLARFRAGALSVVVNCGVLVEGYDEPAVDCIIIARPTRSRTLYLQMLGRGTRLHPGKEHCLVIDCVGATTRHDLMTAATVLRLPRKALETDGAAAALAAERAKEARLEQEGRLVAQLVDLFAARPLHWVAASAGRFVLPLGAASLLLVQNGDRWRVLLRGPQETRVLADGLPLDYAQGTAEDYARRAGAGKLVDPKAAWRSAPATERQLSALRRCRIKARPDLTRGEASDLLAAAIAGAGRW